MLNGPFYPAPRSPSRAHRAAKKAKRKEHSGKVNPPTFILMMFFSCSSWLFAPCSLLFNDLVRARQHVGRNRQADLLGGPQIDQELKLCGLLDGKLSRLSTFEDFVYVGCGTPVLVR